MRPRSTTLDRLIAQLAGRAQGVVTRRELLGAGVSADQVRRRVRSGALIVEFPGVYRVGHRAPSVEARYMAAVKACGEAAGLSGMAAAYLHELLRGRSVPAPEVTAPTKRRVRGVITHRSRDLELTIARQIPVTTVARTLVDIAAVLDEEQLTRVCHEAQVRHRTTPADVDATLERRPTSPGTSTLRSILRGDTHVTLSALERRFLQRLREAGLPLPDHTNHVVGEHRVDCRWTMQRLTVELDSYRFHNTRHAFELDRRRERAAYARGDQHRRYTPGDVFEDPRAMLRELAGLLVR